jgi:4-hydroxybenzoate polyprenyltransferase
MAIMTAFVLMVGGLLFSFYIETNFGWTAFIYTFMILAYSTFLKHIVILDVLIVALGFVLRAVAGAVIIQVSISSWLLVCTIFLANHRKILDQYSSHLLDLMIVIVAACTVMAYALYTTASETVEKFGTRNLLLTLPFVLYGIFRYLYLVHQKNLGGSPELILLKDRPMQLNIFLYVLTVGFVLYYYK